MELLTLIISVLFIAKIVINRITDVIDSLSNLKVSIHKLKNHPNANKGDSSKK